MTTVTILACIAAACCIGLTIICLAALIVAGNADDRDEHARRDMRERLGVGQGVDQLHNGQER